MNLCEIRDVITNVFDFYILSKNKSINITSKELGISQSTLSRSIKVLESKVNKKLVVRNYDGIVLTNDGNLFLKEILCFFNTL